MTNFFLTSLAVLGTAAVGLTAAANTAPPHSSSADVTINQLRAQGFEVIVNRVGHAAPEQCTISAVRPGPPLWRFHSPAVSPGGAAGVLRTGSGPLTPARGKMICVDLSC
ncbi:hypothetical protein C8E89_11493 [Mycolicibacterium moriokaense]|uniref:PASTA domain-containing protein n=1 Tax=Mycolicibacterium moriokaense TaxID=39691 RepID=A0A318HD86_9MYCO|nr:hypothetical protein C8E89_11493 [Mycolicibacterium moriokaense]